MHGALWTTWAATVAAGANLPAVIDAASGRALTRGQLAAEAARVASGAPPDLQPGETVAFALPNAAPWLALFLAIQRLGAAALPLDATLPAAHQATAAAALGASWLAGEEHWRRIGPPTAGAFCLWKTTSGTTGQPKPLPCTAENMLADGRQIASTMGIGPADLNLGAVPFGHSYGLGNLVLPLIFQGTAVVCSGEMLPDALAALIERHAVTVFPSAPAIFRALAQSSVEATRLASLRRVISAGAPLPAAVAAQFHERFDRPIHNFYGSSETGGICFDRTGEGTAAGRSVGTPMDGVNVQLEADGRVTVRSSAVIGDGAHTLPDLGRWNEQGELVLTGRASALANIGGKKVAPQEVEAALRSLAGVTDAWVSVRTRSGVGGGDFLVAAVETERSREEVSRELAERLPGWQIPRRLWVAPHLPRTARGKLDRVALEEM